MCVLWTIQIMVEEHSSWSEPICDLSGIIIGNYKGFTWRASQGIAVSHPHPRLGAQTMHCSLAGRHSQGAPWNGEALKLEIQQRGFNKAREAISRLLFTALQWRDQNSSKIPHTKLYSVTLLALSRSLMPEDSLQWATETCF